MLAAICTIRNSCEDGIVIETLKFVVKKIPGVYKMWQFFLNRRPHWIIQWQNGRQLRRKPIQQVFTTIYAHNRFQCPTNAPEDLESVSGPGSSMRQTATLRKELPLLLKRLPARRLLDIPCGDFNWMRAVDLEAIEYTGADIVKPLIDKNQEVYGKNGVRFLTLDLTKDRLPPADLVLVRDCFVHLSFEHIQAALRNLKSSEVTYLLTTTFSEHEQNVDVITGGFRPLNFNRPPFNFPEPIELIPESMPSAAKHKGKMLGLWRVDCLTV